MQYLIYHENGTSKIVLEDEYLALLAENNGWHRSPRHAQDALEIRKIDEAQAKKELKAKKVEK